MNKENLDLSELHQRVIERIKSELMEAVLDETDPYILAGMLRPKENVEEYERQAVFTLVEEYGFDPEEAEETASKI